MSIEQEVVAILKEKRLKIATAESCTGGLVAKSVTDVAGASEVFDCGIVSYANEIKWGVLGVRRETVETYGAVSEQTAGEMARCAATIAHADIGVSTTGIAGPTGGTPEKPNGTCYIGFYDGTKTVVKRINTGLSDREKNRQIFAEKLFELIKEELHG